MSNSENRNIDTEEEEWEKAETRLANLNLISDVSNNNINDDNNKIKSTVNVPLPINYQTQSSFDNAQNYSINRVKIPNPVPIAEYEEDIDDAIFNATFNPKERLFVLNIEYQILQFLKTNDSNLVLPPSTNSFRRLLMHRVAHRFHLSRSEHVLQNGDRGMILSKTADIIIPRPLLVDIPYDSNAPPPSYYEPAVESVNVAAAVAPLPRQPSNESVQSDDTSGSNGSKPAAAGSGSGKKVTMMKRSSDKGNSSMKKNDQQASEVSLSQAAAEKERVYNEAKARIFNANHGKKNEKSPTESSAVTTIQQPQYYEQNESISMNLTSVPKVSSTENALGLTIQQKKALERDRTADERDPDFNRSRQLPQTLVSSSKVISQSVNRVGSPGLTNQTVSGLTGQSTNMIYGQPHHMSTQSVQGMSPQHVGSQGLGYPTQYSASGVPVGNYYYYGNNVNTPLPPQTSQQYYHGYPQAMPQGMSHPTQGIPQSYGYSGQMGTMSMNPVSYYPSQQYYYPNMPPPNQMNSRPDQPNNGSPQVFNPNEFPPLR